MNQKQILDTIGVSALTAKGIAHYAGIDLQSIETECWDMVENGLLLSADSRDQKKGVLAFTRLIKAK